MDDLNPKFSWLSPVHFDELDPMQMLHNARFPAHVERATVAWYSANGRQWTLDVHQNPDQFHVVRELRIEYLNPLLGPGSMRIDIWVERLGNTSCVYGFLCSSSHGRSAYELEMSKSGLFAHFGSKEDLQLAAIEGARQRFLDEVVRPALAAPRGYPRLMALCRQWLNYLSRGVFPGGCFFAAASFEFDGRPGPVRDAIATAMDDWLATLE